MFVSWLLIVRVLLLARCYYSPHIALLQSTFDHYVFSAVEKAVILVVY